MLLHRVRRQLFFDPLADRPGDLAERLHLRQPGWLVVLALSSCVVALIPLAYASPADPLWIAGIYDAADSDEVVVAAASLESLIGQTLLVVGSVSIVPDSPVAERLATPAGAALDAAQPRAPPTS